jgi:aminopeptidase N
VNYLAEQMAVVDVLAIHQARDFVKRSLAEQLNEQFSALYQENHKEESGQLSAKAIGHRRIKNIGLDYLSQLETEKSYPAK